MKKIDCNQKGRIAEKHLEFIAALKGWDCIQAPKDQLHYDTALLRTKKEGWQKVQVKFCGPKRTRAIKSSTDIRRTKNRAYKKGQCDYIYTYDMIEDRAWLIPFSRVARRTEIIPSDPCFNKYEVKV